MNERNHDTLPQSAGVSALVRRIVFKLDAELRFNGHAGLSNAERAGLFYLADASAILDRIATLPGMAQHEERARRDLLELYDVFDQTMPTSNPPIPAGKVVIDSAPKPEDFDAQQAEREAAHHAQLDAFEDNAGADPALTLEDDRREPEGPFACQVFEDDLRGLER